MATTHPSSQTVPESSKPMTIVGAGPLTSTIWKSGDQHSGWRYRFNLFKQLSHSGRVSQQFRPADLIHLIKLTQVLAAVLADDGCLTKIDRLLLQQVASALDAVLERPGLGADTSSEWRSTIPPTQTPTRGNHYGKSSHS